MLDFTCFVFADFTCCFFALGRWLAAPLLWLDLAPLADEGADLAMKLAVDDEEIDDYEAGLATKLAVDDGLGKSGVGTTAWRIWRGCGWLGECSVGDTEAYY